MFLTSRRLVKVGDFGIAKVLTHTVELARTMVGTPYYLSPEIVESKPYSFKSDIWSMGVMLYELCALRPPFDGANINFLCRKIVQGHFSPIPSHFSRNLKSLIDKMLTLDPRRRPNINQVLQIPIIQERVSNFLAQDQFKQEFSHTILHNQNVFNPRVPKRLPDIAPPSARDPQKRNISPF